MAKEIEYMARLFAPDGSSVSDYVGATIEEVWRQVEDGGSRWVFYPIAVVVRTGSDKQTGKIVDAPDEIAHWKGRTVGAFARAIAAATAGLPDRIETTRAPDERDIMARV